MNKLYTKKELSVYLNISMSKINLLLKNNNIPYYKIQKNVRFDIDSINNWLKDKKRIDKFNPL